LGAEIHPEHVATASVNNDVRHWMAELIGLWAILPTWLLLSCSATPRPADIYR